MASTAGQLPVQEAVQVLVSSLSDDSPLVREASLSALKDVAPLNPLLVLDCCSSVAKAGRRRFGNMAGVFEVMASAMRALDKKDADSQLLERLTKIATSEIMSSKELDADWQRSAASLLVSIGLHAPDLMMEEIFHHLAGNSALPAMVQILADFASAEALQFTPWLKDVLLRVLPVLGNVRDIHRPNFANAFKCWSQAVRFTCEFTSTPFFDSDVTSFLNSVFELLLRAWTSSRDLKVRFSTMEALGEMVGFITRPQLKAALPRLIPTVLDLYKKDQDHFLTSHCLHNVLAACLLAESGPPLLDFEELKVVLSTLLPVACSYTYSEDRPGFSRRLKTYNEIQRCFLVISSVYPEDLSVFLLNRFQSKDEPSVVGTLCIIKHLLPRSLETWHDKRTSLVEAVNSLLEERSIRVRKALAELIVVMASHCYISGPSAEVFVEYLVRHCAIPDEEINNFKFPKEVTRGVGPFRHKGFEVATGPVSAGELRSICEKGLLLVAITIPEMEHILWPFILKMIIPMEYTGAVATICKCISELCRRRLSHSNSLFSEFNFSNGTPNPEDLYARLLVLLHDPLAREQQANQILTVLCYLGPLFPKNLSLFWQDEVPKMKAYIGDPDDLKQDSSYQEVWDDMIINFLAESLDVVQDSEWVISLGNAFAKQYTLYSGDHEHTAMLQRCLGMLLQKVDDSIYVREKIEWMYKQADISVPLNRLGLAKGMGLVAASHLDTVLEKLKSILDSVGQSQLQRFLSFFSGRQIVEGADDIYAALALMYGYAARYAPSTVIEARINALVGTNMLSRLLHVQHPTAKQAVINAIELLGQAVINAAEMGISFPLKRRDQLLDYVLTLMGREETESYTEPSLELLQTQSLALRACTILTSIEPKLPLETRNHVLKATLGLFALPNNKPEIVDPLIDNLIALLSAILVTSGEDGRSRAEQLLHILRNLDIYVSSSVEHQRRRGCLAVHEILQKFRLLCSGGYCRLGCQSSCTHNMHSDLALQRNFSTLPSAFVLPSRDSLCVGERVMSYLPRCADPSPDIRKLAVQILGLFFSISLSLPRSGGAGSNVDLEVSYNALSSLEDVISILRRDASIDQSEVFSRVLSSVGILLTKDELVVSLHTCTAPMCDKIKQSADGAIQAVSEFIVKRGKELNDADVSRTAQSLLSATMLVLDKHSRQEILNSVSCLAESTNSNVVFSEVLATAGREIVRKDVSRMRGGWPIQDAFYAFSQHGVLSSLFLDHVLSVLDQTPVLKAQTEKGENASPMESSIEVDIVQAAFLALTAVFRKAVEQSYSSVLCSLLLHLGSCCSLSASQQDHLRILLTTFQSFCDCVGDLEMGKILAREGEHIDSDKCIGVIREVACCIALKRPKEVPPLCMILSKALNRHYRSQREAAAAALSEFIRHSDWETSLLKSVVEALCLHVSDESPTVRSLCLEGLVQIPPSHIQEYIAQVIGVIVALLEDPDEAVKLTALQCLLLILKSSPKDAIDPVLISVSVRLRNLQTSMNTKMRATAFAAYGALSEYGMNLQQQAFLEQAQATLPRLLLHLHDEDMDVRLACQNTIQELAPLMEINSLPGLLNKPSFSSDHRSDYEDFIKDLSRLLSHLSASRLDTYVALIVQAFDAPWPIIQANAIYFASCILSHVDDQKSLAPYFSQVFGKLLDKASRSPDVIVRVTSSLAIGLLLKMTSPQSGVLQHDREDSSRSS